MSSRTATIAASVKRPLLPPSHISSLTLPPPLIRSVLPSSQPAQYHLAAQRQSIDTARSSRPSSPRIPDSPKQHPGTPLSNHLVYRHNMSSSYTEDQIPQIILDTRKAASGIPGEQVEPRQTLPTEDMEPDQSKSIPLPLNRQSLIDDVIALYSCQPTVERVARYARACVYDDQFVYANDRYKMAGQWFGLPKLFPASENLGYEIVKNDDTLIQFKNKQRWSFHLIPKKATINALVSLVLDPATKDSEFPLILYHKDQANEKDYSHEGFGFSFKKTQADIVAKFMSSKEVNYFKGDETAEKEAPKKYGSGTAQAPLATNV
ncbi:hypothetical protein EHS25_009167 [Saitozyma podzolica]|uniref:Uncharacterized protein n=1 Tax=Saitozyma podzolica TaxID=1890683 RepID=A0A427YL70_9TREE|nr:hypothetical protein EHS25_009167 [Saitozyma podzolica]